MESFDKEKAELLFSLGVDDLYFELGSSLEKPKFGMAPRPRNKVVEVAIEWCKSKKTDLAKRLCDNKKFQSLLNSQSANRKIELASVAFDAIASLSDVFGGVPTLTLSVLVVRELAHNLCESSN